MTSRVVDVESLDLRLVQLRTLGTDAWRMANFQVPFFSWGFGDETAGWDEFMSKIRVESMRLGKACE